MNAFRKIIKPENGRIVVEVPKEYDQQNIEVVLTPLNDSGSTFTSKDPQKLAIAHKIIDEGTNVSPDFLSDFKKHNQDRPLPFRNE